MTPGDPLNERNVYELTYLDPHREQPADDQAADVGQVPPLEVPPVGVQLGELPPIRVAGRGLPQPVLHSWCDEQCATLRIDDQVDAGKWVEVRLPLWYLRRLIQEVELKNETGPLTRGGPEAAAKDHSSGG